MTEDKDQGAGLIHQIASPLAGTEPRLSRERLRIVIEGYIQTARAARKQYEDGAAERVGADRESYLDYAHAQSVREMFLRDIHASLDFDLFGSVSVSAHSGIAGPMSEAQKSSSTLGGGDGER